jgi:hypothetical protein
MMPSSSQVYDHQLIFQIISRVGQFHHRPKRGEMRVCPKKGATGCQEKLVAAAKHRGVGEVEVVVEERRSNKNSEHI